MGGRGASSGISNKGLLYGTEYHSVLAVGNIKFVKKNEGSATAPMETMTKGRVYVTVNDKNELKSISYYDKNNKRMKQVDLDHTHIINNKREQPHKHKGYFHNEKGDYITNNKEKKLIDFVVKTWQNKSN